MTTTAIAPTNGNGIAIDENAVLRALKLDPRDVNAQAVLLVCQRYGLDPILRHMLLIEGRPYITRDGLLHVAHRSGQLDGIEVLEEGVSGGEWTAKVAVYRKDMSHPFTFAGRYSGQNKKYGPEMAIKTAEVMALRRAFDVTGIPVLEEQADKWDATQRIDRETGEIQEPPKHQPRVREEGEPEYRTMTAAGASKEAWRWFAVQADAAGFPDHADVCKAMGVQSLKDELPEIQLGLVLDRLHAVAKGKSKETKAKAQATTQEPPADEEPIEAEAREVPAGETEAPPTAEPWRSVGYADAQANKAHYFQELSAFQKVLGRRLKPAGYEDLTLGEIVDRAVERA